MKLKKVVKVNTYACEVQFIITDDIYKIEMDLYKKHGGEKPVYSPAEGYTINVNARIYVMVLDYKFLSHNLIAHEIYHLTCKIGDDREITDEESRAWLCGFLAEEFYKWFGTEKTKSTLYEAVERFEKEHGAEPAKS